MSFNSPRLSQFGDLPYHRLDVPDPGANKMRDSLGPREKESSYYMDNYEATITVHSSPPQQRKQYFDYIEIDDETSDIPERSFSSARLSKRKNLRVTFSDHIDVDFIDGTGDASDEDFDDCDGVVEESMFEVPFDRTKGLKQISSSAEFKRVSENISASPTGNKSSNSSNTNSVKPVRRTSPVKQKCPHQVQASQQANQPLLQKRREPSKVSLSELEKKTKQFIEQMHDKNKKAETQARVAKALFPDITNKVKAQPSYKQFIANAKRAVEITRRYERPWVSGNAATQPTFSVWKKRSETVRRTASLPKNFKLPDDLTRRPGSESAALTSGNRIRIRNS